MWFRNLQVFRIPHNWELPLADFDKQLSRQLFQACGSQDAQSRGWISPRGNDQLVHSLNRQWLIALGSEQKLLPGAVVKQEAQQRAIHFEEEQGYKPGRKQMQEIRDQVTMELLPRAFSRYRSTQVWLDPIAGWLCMDASSTARADEILEVLGKSLDDAPVSRLRTQVSPAAAMADWLASGEAPSGFTVDRDCELKAHGNEQATVRYVRHALDGDEIRSHLEQGKQPTRLGLTWNDRISFILTDKLEIKRLAFLDILKEDAEKQAQDNDELFDIEFTLMTGELNQLLTDLTQALGGEAEED